MSFNKYRTKGAYHYEWYETEDWYKWMVDRCIKFCKGDILDVGCGDGVLVNLHTHFATGIDSDPDAIMLAKQQNTGRPYKEFLNQSIYKSLGDEDWQYMASINAIEHLDKPERLKEILRDNITKGAIITTIDYQGGALGEDHKFEWTYDEMMDFFKEFNPKGFRYKDTEWIGVEIRK